MKRRTAASRGRRSFLSHAKGRLSGPVLHLKCPMVFELQVEKWVRVNRRPRKRKRRETEEVFAKVGAPQRAQDGVLDHSPRLPQSTWLQQ